MQCTQTSLYVAAIFLTAIISLTNCYTITVDAHAEECFFERVKADTKLALTFDIVEGGFLDIDVTITGPDGSVIYKGERESSGMYTFSATTSGRYTYCFSNKIPTMTSKVVMFNLKVGDTPSKHSGEKDEEVNHNKLDDMIKELAKTLKTVKDEQEYMSVTESIAQ